MDDPLVRIRGVELTLRGRRVLEGIDLDVAAGETLALLGPNGAGKTSLLRLVAGRLAPGRGTVRVAGADPRQGRTRRGIGWVPQEIALYPRLTVAENLDVFASLAGIRRRERPAAVAAALDLADLAGVADRAVGTLSGGYQRRVNIAASLIDRPRLILLDEPTSGVDLAARAAIHAVLERLKAAGTAILIATHDFAEAERLAARVAFVARGRLVRQGRLADLLAGLRFEAPERELSLTQPVEAAAVAVLRRHGFTASDPDGMTWRSVDRSALDGAALLGTLRAQGLPVAEVRVRAPRLEALYLATLAPRAAPERAAAPRPRSEAAR